LSFEDDDVRWLEIAVNDAQGMRCIEAARV
jgi:hypothetical protein